MPRKFLYKMFSDFGVSKKHIAFTNCVTYIIHDYNYNDLDCVKNRKKFRSLRTVLHRLTIHE